MRSAYDWWNNTIEGKNQHMGAPGPAAEPPALDPSVFGAEPRDPEDPDAPPISMLPAPAPQSSMLPAPAPSTPPDTGGASGSGLHDSLRLDSSRAPHASERVIEASPHAMSASHTRSVHAPRSSPSPSPVELSSPPDVASDAPPQHGSDSLHRPVPEPVPTVDAQAPPRDGSALLE